MGGIAAGATVVGYWWSAQVKQSIQQLPVRGTMNFTFVSQKGARPEHSELVKSHVMRESQRRRREAKQRRNGMMEWNGLLTTMAGLLTGP